MSQDRGPEVAGTAGFFLAFSWIFVLLRCYTRIFIVKSFGVDDYLSVLAQLFFTAFCAFALSGVKYGTGKHTVDIIPASNLPLGLKWWWCCEPAYVICNFFLKISIGIFLLRIAIYPRQRHLIYFVMILSSITGVMYFWLFIFQCNPPQYFWEQYLANSQGLCLNTAIIIRSTYAYSAVCCLTDWTYCILPAIMVIPLQMNIRTKLSVIFLLSLSAIASIATIVRFPYLEGLSDVADFLWSTTDVAIWSISESGLAIVTSSAAALRPLLRNFLARSNLLHNSTTHPSQVLSNDPWPKTKDPERAGYLRSASSHTCNTSCNHGNKSAEIQLRYDLKRDVGIVTTVCGEGSSSGSESSEIELDERPSGSAERHRAAASAESVWNQSDGDERPIWPSGGITKTTVICTHF